MRRLIVLWAMPAMTQLGAAAQPPAIHSTLTPPAASVPAEPVSAGETTAAPGSSAATSSPGIAKPKMRQREGTQFVDRGGRFERRGDRVVFLAAEPQAQFFVLENLALERVLRVLE